MYGGLQMGDVTIGVTRLPDRKKVCLYYQRGTVLCPLAYFTKGEFAELFWKEFQRFVYRQPDCPWK